MERPWTRVGSLEDIPLEGVTGVVADVDHTLVDFDAAHAAAIDRLKRAFDRRFGEEVHATFSLVLEGSRRIDQATWEFRDRYRDALAEIGRRQPWSAGAPRKWSRETWMEIASDALGLGYSTAEIAEARDEYWGTLSAMSARYQDARCFLEDVERAGLPLVLMTASDSVLTETDGGFSYDPVVAKEYKLRRLRMLPFLAHAAVIGDPHDKPSPEFFDEVDAAVKGLGLEDNRTVIAVGDSPRSDLEVPAARGYRTYHVDRA